MMPNEIVTAEQLLGAARDIAAKLQRGLTAGREIVPLTRDEAALAIGLIEGAAEALERGLGATGGLLDGKAT